MTIGVHFDYDIRIHLPLWPPAQCCWCCVLLEMLWMLQARGGQPDQPRSSPLWRTQVLLESSPSRPAHAAFTSTPCDTKWVVLCSGDHKEASAARSAASCSRLAATHTAACSSTCMWGCSLCFHASLVSGRYTCTRLWWQSCDGLIDRLQPGTDCVEGLKLKGLP